jgi:hypothetical protein
MSYIPGPDDRPDQKEFWQLSELVLKHDAAANDEDEAGLLRIIEEFIPENVAGYVATQRTMFMLSGNPLFLIMRMVNPDQFIGIHTLAAASWIDGFCAGAAYQKKYGEKVSE